MGTSVVIVAFSSSGRFLVYVLSARFRPCQRLLWDLEFEFSWSRVRHCCCGPSGTLAKPAIGSLSPDAGIRWKRLSFTMAALNWKTHLIQVFAGTMFV